MVATAATAMRRDQERSGRIMHSIELNGGPSNGHIDPVDEGSEELSAEPSLDRKRRHGDPYATHALTDNPLLLPLMAHPEPMQRRDRSFNDDLAWIRVAERYSIVARSTEHDVYRCTRRWQGFKNGFLNLIASFVVATSQLANTEAVIGCVVTIISVTAYWTYGQYLAAHMNWSIVSLAVVFPITQAYTIYTTTPPRACTHGTCTSIHVTCHVHAHIHVVSSTPRRASAWASGGGSRRYATSRRCPAARASCKRPPCIRTYRVLTI